MFKLMIVEDEPLIRTGLTHYFSWQELGFHTIIEAENGREGLAAALREQPDLVITDIRMPEMDGLQMIQEIRAELPDTVFIILTGFNDFELAQKAIRIGGIHAFLLKPLEYEESLRTIQECMTKLEQKKDEQQNRSKWELRLQESETIKGSQLVKLFLEEENAALDEDTIEHLYTFKSTSYKYQPFVMTWLPPYSVYPQTRKQARQQAEKIINEALAYMYPPAIQRQIYTYMYKSKLYAITLLEDQQNKDIENEVKPYLDHLLRNFGMEHHTSLFMAIGTPTADLLKVSHLLRQTDKALYQRFYKPDQILFLPASESSEASPSTKKPFILQLDDKDKQRMIACMESGNETDTQQLMQRLAQEIADKTPYSSPEKWLVFLQEIISVTIRFANKNSIPIEGIYSDKLLNLAFVDDFPTLEALFEWLARWMLHLALLYQQGLTQNPQQDVLIFDHIEAFIKQHIDEDVTLQMVADRFFYNPSYLSRLFKRKLDKNYMKFVTEIRMEYAQECLRKPEYLVTDVCTMCGYKSYKHFVKTFRSMTGMTPTDYRKKSGW
ncbi:MAG: response regulator [Candidatus Pristimantibacillus sp.]